VNRREFLQVLGSAAASGLVPYGDVARAQTAADQIYEAPAFGNVSVLHITDTHAQALPVYFREPNINIGIGSMRGRTPHVVGREFLKYFEMPDDPRLVYAFTYLDFERYAGVYGKLGGYAHLATLIKKLRAQRPGALLVDGGDTWHGSGVALWTKGQDMIEASKLLGVDAMTLHWESTYGQERVEEVAKKDFDGKIDIIAQNVKTADFGDPVFKPYILREINGVPVAVIGQAFPYTPIANPRYFVPDWTFGIQEENMQKSVNDARAKGAKVVVLLSHNGMDVDLKMASRVTGIDAILGGHTHDGVPKPTLAKLTEKLALSEGLLYRRGNFTGTSDQVIVDALLAEKNAEIAFSPGFRWGTTVMPGESITMEHVLDQTAITYPYTTRTEMTGAQIKDVLEDVCDNLFNPDPYYQQGGDMVRVGGMTYSCDPNQSMGKRINDMALNGKPIDAAKAYAVAGWAPVSEAARDAGGEPIWDLVARYLRNQKTIKPPKLNVPKLQGQDGNPGLAL
jgi:2',3'-cyclic-nucleotide 2'-phosphodiesterase (5'-nucleotidase family)